MYKIGDQVTVICSPYYSVKNGSVFTILDIITHHFGNNKHLYILDTETNKLFREFEIKHR